MQLIRRAENNKETTEQGSIIIEVLVGIIILSIMALGLMRSTLMSLRIREHSVRSSYAMQIAADTIETYSAINPSSLTDSNDLTDVVTRIGVSFNRVVNVTVNADDSRTIDVAITPVTIKLGGQADLSVVVIPWEIS